MPRTIDNAPWPPLYALGTGLMQAPPEDLPELTRGLPDYEQRDPAELAAMRTRMGVIPQQGRPDITPEHAATALTSLGSAFVLPEAAALRAMMATGRIGATALGSLGAYLYGTEQPNAEEKKTPAQIKTEQRILQANGFYPKDKPIDGIEGEATTAARELARQAAEKAETDKKTAEDAKAATERSNEIRAKELEAQTTGNTANTLKETNEATRLTQLGEGNKRLEEVERNVPIWRKGLREYGPPLGYVAGGLLGMGVRAGVLKRAASISEGRAAKAEKLFDEELGTAKGATNARVERVNEFYRQGGAGDRVPFVNTPKDAPGFAINPDSATPGTLFGAPRAQNALTDLGANALAGAEMTYAHVQGKDAAAELAASRKELNDKGPTENNIQRLQTAQDQAAWYDFLENAGRGSAILYNGKAMIKHRQNVKPDMSAAGTERLDLEAIARNPPAERPTRSRAAKPAPVAPTPDPAIAAAEIARRESRKFTDQGESLGDILMRAAQSMRNAPADSIPGVQPKRFMPPDL
jgi:peptidoglycan hydrolase-like protein with peptidoglycan-binding domain